MKVTDEMIKLYGEVWEATPQGEPGARRRAALQAVLDLIDPVPEGVMKIEHRGDEYYRVTAAANVWRAECGCCAYIVPEIIDTFGDAPITWEGK